MKIDDLEKSGEIVRLPSSRKELQNLARAAKRLLGDAENPDVSPETRLDLAYQVILTTAKLALRTTGYRLRGHKDEHLRTINTLSHTLGKDREALEVYHSLRRKRHKDLYLGSVQVSRKETEDAIREAKALLREALKWLKEHHPESVK